MCDLCSKFEKHQTITVVAVNDEKWYEDRQTDKQTDRQKYTQVI